MKRSAARSDKTVKVRHVDMPASSVLITEGVPSGSSTATFTFWRSSAHLVRAEVPREAVLNYWTMNDLNRWLGAKRES